jgi:pimeloyl-ACP methyl ester carboxylesterase
MKFPFAAISLFIFISKSFSQSVTDTIVLRDVDWDKTSPASQIELKIPSMGSLIQGFIYKANGAQKHPTLILLHGYPGNERNLDLAQVARARGWNVIYFNYRGAWASQGQFSFENCVQDVVSVVAFCRKYSDSLQVDTSRIALFGHSMGGWVCLKALQRLPGVKKGFALSTWDIYAGLKEVKTPEQLRIRIRETGNEYFVLNTAPESIFKPVLQKPDFFNLATDGAALADKQIIMLDEHHGNKAIASAIKEKNRNFFDYQVWQTDHPFTNKRVALIKLVLTFLEK